MDTNDNNLEFQLTILENLKLLNEQIGILRAENIQLKRELNDMKNLMLVGQNQSLMDGIAKENYENELNQSLSVMSNERIDADSIFKNR